MRIDSTHGLDLTDIIIDLVGKFKILIFVTNLISARTLRQ